ncbi:Uncharacterised protein [Mycobacteroides abscessus subsp. bolletii]|nr:Uncharacterised protein [Mycobacteroides abscessus subsp. bolletii]SHW20763.1 Uncharacterised protein [Mycobacteroides abscessus subsp. bolletii]SHW21223.1 Uncharacterised protein [Mycobacteroides abscessus subsp. bolletii]SHW70780.1 Uncharacterised protein [Mycobacteroides abscessus subsp. bolletii]SIJ59712.1 Uncharacterised protein [Mycobacteroides abscessus subsp. bolletii]
MKICHRLYVDQSVVFEFHMSIRGFFVVQDFIQVRPKLAGSPIQYVLQFVGHFRMLQADSTAMIEPRRTNLRLTQLNPALRR